jgi:GT2 family glycosyltransferase
MERTTPSAPAEPAPAVPSVLAVVVVHDPGPWLDDTLTSLADQDYPRLNVLVVDAGSADDVATRVKEALPEAAVVRREAAGFGEAANVVLEDGHRAAL